MSRDYKSSKSNTKAKKGNGSLFFGILIGYALGLMSAIGIWMYINESPSPFLAPEKKPTSNRTVLEASKAPQNTPAKTISDEAITTAVDERNRFDFYEILPGVDKPVFEQPSQPIVQAQVPPPTPEVASAPAPELALAAPPPPPMSSPAAQQPAKPAESIHMEHYFLQAGSFRNTNEAENLKARLALLGVVAEIQSADIAESGVWYRVRIGPFIRMAKVEEVRVSLQLNGIDTQFIKIRGNL